MVGRTRSGSDQVAGLFDNQFFTNPPIAAAAVNPSDGRGLRNIKACPVMSFGVRLVFDLLSLMPIE